MNIANANLAALSAANTGDGAPPGYLKATVTRGPDRDGGFLLRLDGGRDMIVVVDRGVKIPPGTNVFVSPSDGKILIPTPDAAAQARTARDAGLVDSLLPGLSADSATGAGKADGQAAGQVAGAAGTVDGITRHGVTVDVAITAEKIHASLESALLKSLPVSSLEKIAAERGGLDLETLKALDGALRGRGAAAGPLPPEQVERLEQWLRVALDNPKLIEDLAERAPVLGAREIAERFQLLERVGITLLSNNVLSEISPERFFLSGGSGAGVEAAGLNIADRGQLLEALLSRAFASAPTKMLELVELIEALKSGSGGNQNAAPGLSASDARRVIGEILSGLPNQIMGKPELLHDARMLSPKITEASLMSSVNNTRNAYQAVIPAASNNNSQLSSTQPAAGGNYQTPQSLFDRVMSEPRVTEASPVSSVNNTRNAHQTVIPIASNNNSQLSSTRAAAGGGYQVPQNLFDRVMSEPKFQSGAESGNAVFAQIDSTLKSIRQVIDDAGAAKNTGAPASGASNTPAQPTPSGADTQAASTRIAGLLLTQTENIQAGFQNAFASLDIQSKIAPVNISDGSSADIIRQSLDSLRVETLLNVSRALQMVFSSIDELSALAERLSDGPRALPESERELLRAVEQLARQARLSGAGASEALNDTLRELTRVQTEAMRAEGHAAAARTPAEIMRSAALTAAGSLENLHLLASQTRGTENSQQQMFALPVKMGDEWTEVQVKFIKEGKKSKAAKGADGGHVSVYLNVAPSVLGQVTAHLDFHPPASLKLAFEFEKPEAVKWFREQSGELREALSNAGLPGTALTFYKKREAAGPDTGKNKDAIKTENVGAITKDGKVDFRA